jgi:hypothetical protein
MTALMAPGHLVNGGMWLGYFSPPQECILHSAHSPSAFFPLSWESQNVQHPTQVKKAYTNLNNLQVYKVFSIHNSSFVNLVPFKHEEISSSSFVMGMSR